MADPNGAWRDFLPEEPYYVPATPSVVNPFAQTDIPVVILDEETDEEEPMEYVPGTDEDPEDYIPHEGEPETDSSQELTDSITEEELASLTPSERSMLSCPEGNSRARTARISIPPVTPFPFGGHFEVGGPSHAPPPAQADAPPLDAPTMGQYREVVDRVQQIEEGMTEDTDAMQTMYCRAGADRSYANTLGAHIRALEFRLEVAEREIRAAERERLQLRRQLTALTRYVRRRLG